MYIRGSQACDLPNSSTPMPPEAIAAQAAYISQVGGAFVAGNAALNNLIAALGGNPSGVPSGDAGVPTVGTGPLVAPGSIPWILPTGAAASPGGTAGDGGAGRRSRGPGCALPMIVPLVSGVAPGSPAGGMAAVPDASSDTGLVALTTGQNSGLVWAGIGLLAFSLWVVFGDTTKGRR